MAQPLALVQVSVLVLALALVMLALLAVVLVAQACVLALGTYKEPERFLVLTGVTDTP